MNCFNTTILLFILFLIPQLSVAQCSAEFDPPPGDLCGGSFISVSVKTPTDGFTYDWTFDGDYIGSGTTVSHQLPYSASDQTYSIRVVGNPTDPESGLEGCAHIRNISVKSAAEPRLTDIVYDPVAGEIPFTNCSATPSEPEYTLRVRDDSSPASQIESYTLKWGDGEEISGQGPPPGTFEHTYTERGTFSIVYSLNNTNGCLSQLVISVFNGSNPAVGLGNPGETVNICAPKNISFPITGTEDNPPGTKYFVYVNDVRQATYDHPPPPSYTHLFDETSCGQTTRDGAFNNSIDVRIEASNPCFTSVAIVQPITVGTAPEAAIQSSPDTIGCLEDTFTFSNATRRATFVTNQECNEAVNLAWEISPDNYRLISGQLTGNSLNDANQIRVMFEDHGTYTVRLIASNNCGSDTTYQEIEVTPKTIANAVTLADAPNCIPANVTFENNSEYAVTYDWSVSPGTMVDIDSQNVAEPNMTFRAPGEYIISMKASGCGEDTWMDTIIIRAKPVITMEPIEDGCEFVRFEPVATVSEELCPEVSCEWTFQLEDGTVVNTVDDCNPPEQHFTEAGNYLAILSATNCCGTTVDTQYFSIISRVESIDVGEDLNFCAQDSCIDLTTIPNPPDGVWTNENGDTLTEFCLQTAGEYHLIYTIGAEDCSAGDTLAVLVNPIPQLDVFPAPQTVCEDDEPFMLETGPYPGTWSGCPCVTPDGIFDPAQADAINQLSFHYSDTATGCENTYTVQIDVAGLPPIDLPDTLILCRTDEDISLEEELGIVPGPGDGTEWAGDGISSQGVFQISNASDPNAVFFDLSLTYTSQFGCESRRDMVLRLVPKEAVDIGPDTTLCIADNQYQLVADPDIGGSWDGPGINQNTGLIDLNAPAVSYNIPLTYTYIAFEGETCETSDTTILTVIKIEGVDAGADVYVCEDETSVILQGNAPADTEASWSGLEITNIPPDQGEVILTDLPALQDTFTYYFEANSSTLGACGNLDSTRLIRRHLPEVRFDKPDGGCINVETFFENTTTDADAYQWTINGVDISTTVDLTHVFTAIGNYEICLEAYVLHPITGEIICTAILCESIRITEPPTYVGFIADKDEGCADLTVTFTNESQGENLTFVWYEGQDSISDASDSFTYTFGQGRVDTTYIVGLEVANGCGDDIVTDTITVNPQPVAVVGTAESGYCSGDTIRFFNASYGNPTSYKWDFGDPNIPGSTDSIPEPVVYYSDTTVQRTVTLIVENDCGQDTSSWTFTIVPSDVAAGFFIEDRNVCVGDTVCLTNFATFDSEVVYYFSDGFTTTEKNPCRVFTQSGTYEILQKASGCGADTMMNRIRVGELPVVRFDAPAADCPDSEVYFKDDSRDVIDYGWDFGDGARSDEVDPVHIYESSDTFLVILRGTSENGCEATFEQEVMIAPSPVADFIYTDSICAQSTVLFTSQSSSDVTSCAWNFGDGNPSTRCNPTHAFMLGDSIYDVRLEVTNEAGCTDVVSRPVFVRSLPQPDFDFVLSTECAPVEVGVTNLSTNADSYEWHFAGLGSSFLTNPTFPFTEGGIYPVTLTASVDGICYDSITKALELFDIPEAIIEDPPAEGCAPFAVTFSAARAGVQSYFWDFDLPTGANAFTSTAEREYIDPGNYTISLVVDNGHCKDTTTVEMEVHPPVLNSYETVDNLCHGDALGSINVSITSGTGPFEFSWSNGAVSEDLDQLLAGLYIQTITDSRGCILETEIEILEPLPVSATEVASEVVSCYGGDDGRMEVLPTGGTPDYQLRWSNGGTSTIISNVSAGIYTLTITDASGCIGIQDFEVLENAPIEPLDRTTHISCFGRDDGIIRLDTILGGAPPFQVNVQGPNGYENFGRTSNNLLPGFYLIDITDAEGCETGLEIQIVEPDSIYIDIIPEDTSLLLGQTLYLPTLYNAQEPVFEWEPERWLDCTDCDSPLASPQQDIVYKVQMTDAYGCVESDQIRIEVTPARKVYIPNLFTPDGDGHNDIFRLRSGDPGLEKVIEFAVFDRWGAVMFQAKDYLIDDPAGGWQGLVRGKHDAPTGEYTWFAEVLFKDEKKEVYKGTILLIR